MALLLRSRCIAALLAGLMTLTMLHPAAAQQRRLNFIRDAEIEHTIRTFSEPLFTAAGIASDSVSIALVKDNSLNAFVAGGMNLFVHTGLLQQTDDPGQLIGVLAHEIGHIAGGHLVRSKDALENASAEAILATLLGVAAAIGSGESGAGAAIIGGGQEMARRSLLQYTRTQESAADQAALSYLDQAGMSADGLLAFLDKLADQELLPTDKQAEFVRTHPLTRNRVEAVRYHVETSTHANKALPASFMDMHERMRAKLIGFLQPEVALTRYKADDQAVPGRYGRAIALYRLGQVEEALTAIDTLIRQEPENPFFHELKGQVLFENGRVAEALAPYRKSVELLPSSALLRTAFAHALTETGNDGNLDEAIRNLDESVRMERRSPFAWRLLATAWGRKGNDGMTTYAMAEAALARGETKEARALAERAEKLLPAGSPGWIRAQDIRTVTDKSPS